MVSEQETCENVSVRVSPLYAKNAASYILGLQVDGKSCIVDLQEVLHKNHCH